MYSRFLLMLLFFCQAVKGQVAGSQSMMESKIIEYKGMRFVVKIDVEIESTNEGGLGERFHKIKIASLASSIHQKSQVDYKGKTYYEYSFNNQLSFEFTKLKIRNIDVSIDLTGSENCKQTSFTIANAGSSKTILCKVDNEKKLGIARINILNATFNGFNELFALIDKLENQSTIDVSNQNNNKNGSDPWGTNEQKSFNTKPSELNYLSNTLPSKTTALSTPKNYNQSVINSKGYDQSGNYIGQGTYNNTGSGKFIPAGPGKLRADGNYDVIDKNTGKVEIISKSENQKLLLKQQEQQSASNIASQQQKMQEMYRQQEQIRINQQKASLLYDQQISQAAEKLTQSVGAMASAIGNMIADAKAKKERERQRELMLAERRRVEAERIAMEKKFRKESRMAVFSNFKEGLIPLSTSKIIHDKLYYFIYAYDQSRLEEEGMRYFVSNIIEIKKAGDGTWPYKRNIDEASQALTPYPEIFHGYYVSASDAEEAKKGFETMLNNSSAILQSISFMEKKTNSSENEKETKKSLWDDDINLEKKRSSSTAKKDSFWEIDSSDKNQKNSSKTQKTNTIDFWSVDEPIKKKETPIIDSLRILLENAIINNQQSIISDLVNKLPEDSSDLNMEALKAHSYFLLNQTDKAIELYKKHKGQYIIGSELKWEDKINSDIIQLKKTLSIDFTPILDLML